MKVRHLAISGFFGLLLYGAVDVPPAEAVIQRGTFVKPLSFTGTLEAAQSTVVRAPSTRIWALSITYLAPEGSHIKSGDLVARFDSSELDNARLDLEKKREDARIKIAQKKAELATKRQDLLMTRAQAEKNFKVAELYGALDPALIPRSDYEKYQFDLQKAKLEREKADERLKSFQESSRAELAVVELDFEQADLDLKKIRAELDRLSLHASAPGILVYEQNFQTNRNYQVGDTIFKGQPLARLPNLESLLIRASVHDTDLPYLAAGLPAQVSLDAFPGRTFRARLDALPKVGTPSRPQSPLKVFRVVARLLEQDLSIMKPGMTARVTVRVGRPEVLFVDRRAVRVDPRGGAYLETPGSAGGRVSVRLVDASAQWAVVEGDIRPGEKVLLEQQDSNQGSSQKIEWIPVKRQDLSFSVAGTGVLDAARSVSVQPPAIPNYHRFRIVRLIPEGKTVQKGDTLVQFDRSELEQRLRDEEASLSEAREQLQKTGASQQVQVKDMELKLEEARVQQEKARNKLRMARQFDSSLKVREAEFAAELADKTVQIDEEKLRAIQENARLELTLLKEKERFHGTRAQNLRRALDLLEIRSPINGVVIYQPNWNNEKKQVGSTAHLMETILTIPDLSSLRVKGQISEVDSGKVHLGQKVTVTLDALPERVFTGKVAAIGGLFKEASRERPIKVLEVTVELEQVLTELMRPGMAARIHIAVDDFRQVLAVPLSVIRLEEGHAFVWVKTPKGPKKREVQVQRDNGIVAVIDSGLRDGEQVCSRPLA